MRINRESLIATILFIVYLIVLAFVSREYRHIATITLLITLLPIVYLKLKNMKQEDTRANTNNFRNRVLYMTLVVLCLIVAYFFMKIR